VRHRWIIPGCLLLLAGCGTAARDPPLTPDDQSSLKALIEDGDSLFQAGEYDSAETRFSSALERSREQGDLDGEAQSLTWLGTVAYRRAEFSAARELLGRALALEERRGSFTHVYRVNTVLGLVGYAEGRYYDALERHEAAAGLAEAAADTVSLAKSWNNIALVRTELGDFDEARRLLLRSLPVAQSKADRRVEGRVLVNLGMLAVRTGDPVAAARYLEEAREPLAAARDAAGELNRLGQIGTAYAAIGEPGRAIAYLDTALTEARNLDAPHEAASNLEHIAAIYRDAGDYARALRMFEQARVLNDSLGLVDEAAFDLRSSAEIYRELGNRDLARRDAGRALAIHRRVGARLQVVHDLLLLARLELEDGHSPIAWQLHAEANRIATSLEARTARLAVALATARMADHDGDHARVRRALREAASDFEVGGMDVVWEAHWLAARAWARAGSLDSATVAARAAVAAVERVRGEFSSDLLRTRVQAAREGVYRDLVEILLRQGRNEEAFEAADAARGRVLLDHLATERTNGSTTIRELAEEERQLLRQADAIAVALDEVDREAGTSDAASLKQERDRLARDLERIRSEYALALTRAEERQTGRLALMGGAPPRLSTVQGALDPGMALLEYFAFPDRLVAFVATSRTFAVHVLPGDFAALATRIRVVRELAGRSATSAGLGSALEALHESLLAPIRRSGALADVNTLLIIPQGELEYVPFAALRDRATGRYVVQDFALLHLPSAAALPVLATRPRPAGGKAEVFAPFPRELPASAAESRAFEDAVRGASSHQGGQANEAEVRRALGRARVVHVASHGILNSRNPLFSRLELSRGRKSAGADDDGRLEVHEMSRIRIDAALVFLSGCETGLGVGGTTGFSRGEDYATLTRAFLNAGARNVIATLWRVEDRGAGEFATRFYRELASAGGGLEAGLSRLAEVLSRTQRDMLREPAFAAPFYWAGFRLTGAGNGGAKEAVAVRS
jgi:CHAT domain-containing protein/tetratricopeptide (TPR) repeat protein